MENYEQNRYRTIVPQGHVSFSLNVHPPYCAASIASLAKFIVRAMGAFLFLSNKVDSMRWSSVHKCTDSIRYVNANDDQPQTHQGPISHLAMQLV